MQTANHQLEQSLQAVMACIQDKDFSKAGFYLDSIGHQTDARVPYFIGLVAEASGKQQEAIRAFSDSAELNNFNPDLTADCIFKLINYGAIDIASKLNRQAASRMSEYFGYHFCSGLIHLKQNELDLAVAEFRAAAKLKPDLVECHTLAAQTLHLLGRLSESEDDFLKALALAPNNSQLHENLAALFIDCEAYQAAYEHAKIAIALENQSAAAWGLLSSAARELKYTDESFAAAEHACRLAPENAECRRTRGTILKELGHLQQAVLDFDFATSKRFAPNTSSVNLLKEHRFLNQAKLEHDIEQLDYLGKIHNNEKFSELSLQHRKLLSALPDSTRAEIVPIPSDLIGSMLPHYNRLHHVQATHYSDAALSTLLDTASVENDYFARSPGITWIDNLLSPQALAAIRRYCLESTIWFDFNHPDGYLGAVLENGFTDPLLLKICDELRFKFPKIFGPHPLMQMWAFKYDSRLKGIQLHGDVAAINLNFWITPDDANLDTNSGGLRIWDKAVPADWCFNDFNSGTEKAQFRIRKFLADNKANEIVVPYRQNRAVVFNSDLFHATDEFYFKDGYENRRINITMLFGRRTNNNNT